MLRPKHVLPIYHKARAALLVGTQNSTPPYASQGSAAHPPSDWSGPGEVPVYQSQGPHASAEPSQSFSQEGQSGPYAHSGQGGEYWHQGTFDPSAQAQLHHGVSGLSSGEAGAASSEIWTDDTSNTDFWAPRPVLHYHPAPAPPAGHVLPHAASAAPTSTGLPEQQSIVGGVAHTAVRNFPSLNPGLVPSLKPLLPALQQRHVAGAGVPLPYHSHHPMMGSGFAPLHLSPHAFPYPLLAPPPSVLQSMGEGLAVPSYAVPQLASREEQNGGGRDQRSFVEERQDATALWGCNAPAKQDPVPLKAAAEPSARQHLSIRPGRAQASVRGHQDPILGRAEAPFMLPMPLGAALQTGGSAALQAKGSQGLHQLTGRLQSSGAAVPASLQGPAAISKAPWDVPLPSQPGQGPRAKELTEDSPLAECSGPNGDWAADLYAASSSSNALLKSSSCAGLPLRWDLKAALMQAIVTGPLASGNRDAAEQPMLSGGVGPTVPELSTTADFAEWLAEEGPMEDAPPNALAALPLLSSPASSELLGISRNVEEQSLVSPEVTGGDLIGADDVFSSSSRDYTSQFPELGRLPTPPLLPLVHRDALSFASGESLLQSGAHMQVLSGAGSSAVPGSRSSGARAMGSVLRVPKVVRGSSSTPALGTVGRSASSMACALPELGANDVLPHGLPWQGQGALSGAAEDALSRCSDGVNGASKRAKRRGRRGGRAQRAAREHSEAAHPSRLTPMTGPNQPTQDASKDRLAQQHASALASSVRGQPRHGLHGAAKKGYDHEGSKKLLSALSQCIRQVHSQCAEMQNKQAPLTVQQRAQLLNLAWAKLKRGGSRSSSPSLDLSLAENAAPAATTDTMGPALGALGAYHITEALKTLRGGDLADLAMAKALFAWAQEQGIMPDGHLWSSIITNVGSAKDWEALEEIEKALVAVGPQGSPWAYTQLMLQYRNGGKFAEMVRVFDGMEAAGVKHDSTNYSIIMDMHNKAGRFTATVEMHKELLKKGIELDEVATGTVMYAYGRMLDDASAYKAYRDLIKRGLHPSVVTCNNLLTTYGKKGRYMEAVELFRRMKEHGPAPDRQSYTTLIAMTSKAGLPEEAEALFEELVEKGMCTDAVSWSTMVGMYGRMGDIRRAKLYFRRMLQSNCKPSMGAFNSLLFAFVKGGMYEEARVVLASMKRTACGPGLMTYSVLLSACTMAETKEDVVALLGLMNSTEHAVHHIVTSLLQGSPMAPSQSVGSGSQFGDDVKWERVGSLLDEAFLINGHVAGMDLNEERRSFADTSVNFLYKFGLHASAMRLWTMFLDRHLYSGFAEVDRGSWKSGVVEVNLHLMSAGTALIACKWSLGKLLDEYFATGAVPVKIELITGRGARSRVPGFPVLKLYVEQMLQGIGLPYSCNNPGAFSIHKQDFQEWAQEVRASGISGLELLDNRLI